MKAVFGLVAGAAVALATSSALAATTAGGPGSSIGRIGPTVSDLGNPPPASAIVTNAGLEWVWANPCSAIASECGDGQPGVMEHSGFKVATDAQWMTWGSLAAFQGSWAGVTCASPQFSLKFDHCDEGDMLGGFIWGSPLTDPEQAANVYSETFLVRVVPEPETYALMLAGLGALGFMVRRRQRG